MAKCLAKAISKKIAALKRADEKFMALSLYDAFILLAIGHSFVIPKRSTCYTKHLTTSQVLDRVLHEPTVQYG